MITTVATSNLDHLNTLEDGCAWVFQVKNDLEFEVEKSGTNFKASVYYGCPCDWWEPLGEYTDDCFGVSQLQLDIVKVLWRFWSGLSDRQGVLWGAFCLITG